ncbi:uncharacterized protein LOC121370785 isoform X1 [Gigantopelta aegis]|uniref:uncharacterized protein LOC121370785 isoform X1 n=1 Tax=Gigantopelta aegis TaxID=1735272 RepID=UPI001B88D2A6|nr:uncharacterized protein LOC121370785 isoform X1 [Gigantopelta aegis]
MLRLLDSSEFNEWWSSLLTKARDHAPSAFKVICMIFSIVGLAATFRWFLSTELSTGTSESVCTASSTEGCPWQHVLSDLANRLQLLEMAFKEQVIARESIAKEVINQSDVNSHLNDKLDIFLEKLELISNKNRLLEVRLEQVTARMHSDETLGFLVMVFIMVEVMVRLEPKVRRLLTPWRNGPAPAKEEEKTNDNCPQEQNISSVSKMSLLVTGLLRRKCPVLPLNGHLPSDIVARKSSNSSNSTDPGRRSRVANGVNYSPKHGISLRPELCVILFKRDNNISSTLVDGIIKHLDDGKMAERPHYTIEGSETLRQIPRVKLYLVISEMEEKCGHSFLRPQDVELHTSAIRFMKSLGASIVLVMTNDEGSKKLTAHSMYNTSLRLVQSHEVLQELTSNGRVFSMWRELTSHQLSHLRKIVKSVLNVKTSVR